MRTFTLIAAGLATLCGAVPVSNPPAQRSPDHPSVAAIFTNLLARVQSDTDQLIHNSSSLTFIDTIHLVASIDTSLNDAIASLDSLGSGVSDSAILASADGNTQLTISQLASVVADAMRPIVRAAANVLENDSQTVFELWGIFDDAGDIIESTTELVPGLRTELEPRHRTAGVPVEKYKRGMEELVLEPAYRPVLPESEEVEEAPEEMYEELEEMHLD